MNWFHPTHDHDQKPNVYKSKTESWRRGPQLWARLFGSIFVNKHDILDERLRVTAAVGPAVWDAWFIRASEASTLAMRRVSGERNHPCASDGISSSASEASGGAKRRHIDEWRLLSGEVRGAEGINERAWITVDTRVNGRAKEKRGRANELIVYPEAK